MSTMNPKGTMDYGFLLDLFETDELDNILDAIIEAAVARRNYLQDVQGAQNKATMVPGTRVRICGTIKPKYLLGIPGTVLPRMANRRGDIMVELDYRAGRYSKVLNIPASCLEMI